MRGNSVGASKPIAIIIVFAVVIVAAAVLYFTPVLDIVRDKADSHDTKYTASTRFMTSTDNGSSWSETRRSVYAGEKYYLAVELQVAQSKDTREEKTVEAVVFMPKTDGLDYSLRNYPGGSLANTTETDTGTEYRFNVAAGVDPAKFRLVFECMPNKVGETSVSVTYDDQLSESWDSTWTISYTEKDDSEEEAAEKGASKIRNDEKSTLGH